MKLGRKSAWANLKNFFLENNILEKFQNQLFVKFFPPKINTIIKILYFLKTGFVIRNLFKSLDVFIQTNALLNAFNVKYASKGSSINHVDSFWTFGPSPFVDHLLNKAYVVIWTFDKPPLPTMSTWLMNAPLIYNALEAFIKIKSRLWASFLFS